MSATVHRIETARIKRAARLVNAAVNDASHCACGCGESLDVDERIAWDSKRGLAYRLAHWLRMEGLAP